ncbi:MAG: hypothetical protein JKY50_04945 [Oleispira sp.]|nr:hypothetical protein [Oleispira sp.]
MKLDSLELPKNLYWQNEFGHKNIAQSVNRTVAGGVVIESAVLSFGQKITLSGAWIKRADALILITKEAANQVVIFTDNLSQNYSVVFDIKAGGVGVDLLSPEAEPDPETLYELTINLLTVEPV